MEKDFKKQKQIINATASLNSLNKSLEKANSKKAEMTENEIKDEPLFDNVTKVALEQLNTEMKRFAALYTMINDTDRNDRQRGKD